MNGLAVAHELARFGRKLTPLERALRFYLFLKGPPPESMKTLDPSGEVTARLTSQSASSLSALFLDAVDRRDGDSLRDLALAVEQFERFPAPADSWRARILRIKAVLIVQGETVTVKQLATLLAGNSLSPSQPPPPTKDDYAYLRRVAKSLGVPLAKPGRPKKSTK